MEINIDSPAALPRAAAEVHRLLADRRVLLLSGELGAGKTTFTQAFCRHIGVTDRPSSPTFSLVNEYVRARPDGTTEPVYHLDLYRLRDVDEALGVGLEEYLYSGHYCIVEWPAVAEGLYPEEVLRLRLEPTGPTSRKILLL